MTVLTNKKVGDTGAANSEADGYATRNQVNEWMEKANEQYAQIGVRFDWTVQFVDQPTGVDLGRFGLDGHQGIATISNEEKDLIRGNFANGSALRSALAGDIELFVIGEFWDDRRGEAFTEEWLRGNIALNDLHDTAIVSWDNKTPFTIPHELGHILLNWGAPPHYHQRFQNAGVLEELPNLMRAGTSDSDGVVESKRLRQHQKVDAYSNRLSLIQDFIP